MTKINHTKELKVRGKSKSMKTLNITSLSLKR